MDPDPYVGAGTTRRAAGPIETRSGVSLRQAGDLARVRDRHRTAAANYGKAVTQAWDGSIQGRPIGQGEVAGDNGYHFMVYDVPSQLPWNRGENPFFVSVRNSTCAASYSTLTLAALA
ncbi:hypothetical protein [Streptomyces atratus]|uniref:hypothetical protein n=1 Tax=Streptomyces atratus TaxID=1893 RepID=UPI0036506352